jgi:rubrerythrin
MKFTIHWLTVELLDLGTETYVFGTREDFLKKAVKFINDRFDSGNPYDRELDPDHFAITEECIAALGSGDLEKAWRLFHTDEFLNGREVMIKNVEDYFWEGTQEIEVPSIGIDELLPALESAEHWLAEEARNPGQAKPDMILDVLRKAISAVKTGLAAAEIPETFLGDASSFDNTQAAGEGWGLFNRDENPEIQRIDEDKVFADDAAAIAFVRQKADEGSAYHKTAISLHDIANPPRQVRNHYKCPRCSHEWHDEWDCECDDDCPACGNRHISPHESEDITE